jgi:hypothetical protein
MDRAVFFAEVKPFFPSKRLTSAQVTGMEAILDGWDKWGYGLDTALAYILATPFWETGKRMVPVRETFASSTKQAISRLDAAYAKGQLGTVSKPYWRSGWFGRGLVQITHEDNSAGPLRDAVLKEFGVDIHKDPDLALREDIAVFLLIEGVTKGVTLKSDYSKWALEDFINEGKTDYVNARKTVNPREAESFGPIAEHARMFERAIRKAREAAGEEFRGPRADNSLYDGKYHEEVESVQKLLVGVNYQVGEVDGRWGTLTRQAVLLFRQEHDLPAREDITDKDFLAALATATPRVLAPARTEATVADLRAKGSETVKTADKVDWTGRIMAGAAGVGGVDAALDKAEKYSDYAARAKALIAPVSDIIHDNFYLILAGLAGVVIFQALKQKRIAAEKYQTGENLTA